MCTLFCQVPLAITVLSKSKSMLREISHKRIARMYWVLITWQALCFVSYILQSVQSTQQPCGVGTVIISILQIRPFRLELLDNLTKVSQLISNRSKSTRHQCPLSQPLSYTVFYYCISKLYQQCPFFYTNTKKIVLQFFPSFKQSLFFKK